MFKGKAENNAVIAPLYGFINGNGKKMTANPFEKKEQIFLHFMTF